MNKRDLALLFCGIVAGAVGWSTFSHLSRNKKERAQETKRTSVDVPQDIRDELMSRVITFFGPEKYEKMKNSFVVVVGLGGVGSHCANMLVRSGIGKVRLIDFDQVSLSSLNRHAVACIDDVGKPKAAVLKSRLHSVVPWCNIESYSEMFVKSEASRLLGDNPDLVLDCIDDVNTKSDLIAFCVNNSIPVITSMGAGGKSDPTKIRIAPLSDCVNDPLASKIRWKLKKHNVSCEKVMSIFSIEKPVAELLPLTAEQTANPQDYGAVDYLRIRVIPVLGTSPSMFGQALASYALCSLAGKLYDPDGFETLSKHLKHKIRTQFKKNEVLRFGTDSHVELDDDDVDFVVQTMWRSRCAISGKRFFGPSLLTLVRWDSNLPAEPYNLVLVIHAHAQQLIAAQKEGNVDLKSLFGEVVVDAIEKRLRWAKAVCHGEFESLDISRNSYNANIAHLRLESWGEDAQSTVFFESSVQEAERHTRNSSGIFGFGVMGL